MYRVAALLSSFAAVAYAQQAGSSVPEIHPTLPIKKCSLTNGVSTCETLNTKIVLDANWRWAHHASGDVNTNCFGTPTDPTGWDQSLCPLNGDPAACAAACAIDGIDYQGTAGIKADGLGKVTLDFVTTYTNGGSSGTNVGSRVFLMDESDTSYKGFNLLNQEFTFTVDDSNVPCGVNGAAYFVQMDLDGGLSSSPTFNGVNTNTAGPTFGTGYCDSTCAQGIKFIGGLANSPGWDSATSSGSTGTCCTELDIWEANLESTALTPHPCSVTKQSSCTGDGCGSSYANGAYLGTCDKAGCDFNPFRMGNTSFYGANRESHLTTIDTSKPFTVVTQFQTHDNTDTGHLTKITRYYKQNGIIYANANSNIAGVPAQNFIDDAWCAAQKVAFNDPDTFTLEHGLSTISDSMKAGHVFVLSIWDDYAKNMNWLDSIDPSTGTAPYPPGVERGTCSSTAGVPATVEKAFPNSSVTFSDIRFGPIGSTL